MKAFVPALRRLVSSRRALRAYASAISLLGRVTLKRAAAQDSTVIWEGAVVSSGAHILAVLYSFESSGWGKVVVTDQSQRVLLKVDVDSQARYRQFLLRLEAPGSLRVAYEGNGGSGLTVLALGIKPVADQPSARQITVSENAVCAAIATYPQRRHLLEEAVNSLAPQVDHLFIYLNNYRRPPSFLETSPFADRIHYILDTNSTLRASAKFFWLNKHRCYWLLCDDDIIYPNDYATRTMDALKRHDNRAVVGVHATIFGSRPDGKLSHHRIEFQRALSRDLVVHMLGTGTVALHSSILDRRDWHRLLRYPTQNDEILAVMCRTKGTPLVAISRSAFWLRSNPRMKYGIFEETQMNFELARRVDRILAWGAPWPDIPTYESQNEDTK